MRTAEDTVDATVIDAVVVMRVSTEPREDRRAEMNSPLRLQPTTSARGLRTVQLEEPVVDQRLRAKATTALSTTHPMMVI